MAEEYTPEIFTLTDEEGVEHEFELMDVMEENGTVYYALVPYTEDPEARIGRILICTTYGGHK